MSASGLVNRSESLGRQVRFAQLSRNSPNSVSPPQAWMMAGDVARLVRGEKREDAGDLLRRRDTAAREWLSTIVRLASSPVQAALIGVSTAPGPNGVDANTVAGEFERQRARQIGHTAFADGIGEIAGFRDDLVDARTVDDAASAAAAHEMRERLMRAEHGAGQVDLDDTAIGFDVDRLAWRPCWKPILLTRQFSRDQGARIVSNILAIFASAAMLAESRDGPARQARVRARRPAREPACPRHPHDDQEIDGDGCAFLREADGDPPARFLRGSGHEHVLRGEAGRNARHTIRRLHGRRHK